MRLAHEIALESRGRVTATAVDLAHHPDLLERYRVSTVPFFVLGERLGLPGPVTELHLLQWVADNAPSSEEPRPPADPW